MTGKIEFIEIRRIDKETSRDGKIRQFILEDTIRREDIISCRRWRKDNVDESIDGEITTLYLKNTDKEKDDKPHRVKIAESLISFQTRLGGVVKLDGSTTKAIG